MGKNNTRPERLSYAKAKDIPTLVTRYFGRFSMLLFVKLAADFSNPADDILVLWAENLIVTPLMPSTWLGDIERRLLSRR